MKLSKAVWLHLLPGIVTIVLIVLSAPLLQQYQLHTGLSFLLAFLFVTIPVHLFLLLREGKKINGHFSFKQVNRYNQSMPVWQYLAFFFGFIVLAFGCLFILDPVNVWLKEHAFNWLPYYLRDSDYKKELSYQAMLCFLILQIIVDGILIPVVEEFYFKGYLLSRMQALGVFAPLLNAALFTLAHFWQPYNYLLIFSIQLPLAYLVWYKKNVYIAIYVHAFGNLFGAVLSLASFLSLPH